MNMFCTLLSVFVTIVHVASFSLLTDENGHNITDIGRVDEQNVEIFKQLLNQETLIRMALVRNVHILMKDMITVKEGLAAAEKKIVENQASADREIAELKREVKILKRENSLLKNESYVHKQHLANMDENITQIMQHNQDVQIKNEAERKMFEKNISDTISDIKIEVRYMSVTLLDLKSQTRDIESRIPDSIEEKSMTIFRAVNSSLNDINTKLLSTDNKLAAAVSKLEKSQAETALSFSDDVNATIESLKAEFKQSQFEQLKLSAAVTSLEMFRMNVTTCGQPKKVAFTVGVMSSNTGWNSGALIFPSVISNVGGGYNPSTGIFTAPTDGNYIFFLTVVEYQKQYSKVDIVMNGVSKVRTMGHSDASYQTGVNMVFLQLQQGDAVWARRYSGTGYYSNSVPITTFSGFLL
ncbi:uncharacterized protein LOC134243929 [Saccostrea cucullata]|uniref:uncharacterized protein LOC134243929 n=1 Tax=Saccostrea cuccullata TaxID=36930 RepID=UPI002ED0053D